MREVLLQAVDTQSAILVVVHQPLSLPLGVDELSAKYFARIVRGAAPVGAPRARAGRVRATGAAAELLDFGEQTSVETFLLDELVLEPTVNLLGLPSRLLALV